MSVLSSSIKNIGKNFSKIYLFFLGFLFCQNIIVPIKIGNTSFNILLFALIPFIIYKFLFHKSNLDKCLKKIPLPYYLFLLSILISFIPALILKSTLLDITPFFKGVFFYCLSVIVPLLFGICLNSEEKKPFFFGLFFGYVVNVFVSIVVYIAFYFFDYVLTFTALFPNDSFFEPNYFSSAQGLFLEPSHLAGFLLVLFYLLFWYYEEKSIRIFLCISVWITFLIYNMGNLPLFIISQIVYFFCMFSKKIKIYFIDKIWVSKRRKQIFVVLCTVILAMLVLAFAFPLRSLFIKLIYEANPFGPANADRMNSLLIGLQTFLKYPLGVGFNLSGVAISRLYGEFVTTATTHNYFLKVLIEQSIPGVSLLIWFIYKLCKALKDDKTRKNTTLLFSVILGFVFSFLNGPTEPYLFLTAGIVCSISNFNTDVFFLRTKIIKHDQYYFIDI